MAKKKSDEVVTDIVLSNEDIINQAIALKSEEDMDAIRKVVCNFFKGDSCNVQPDVDSACSKESCVISCRERYLKTIFRKPQSEWTDDWEDLIIREKKKETEVGLNCDKCYLAENCFSYQAGSTCSIEWKANIAKTSDPKGMLDNLMELQQVRIERAKRIEEMEGGVADQNLSREMDRLTAMIAQKTDLEQDKFSLKIEGTAQGNGGGILSELFKGMAGGNKQVEAPKETFELNSAPEQLLAQPIEFDEKLLNPEPEKRRVSKVKKEKDGK